MKDGLFLCRVSSLVYSSAHNTAKKELEKRNFCYEQMYESLSKLHLTYGFGLTRELTKRGFGSREIIYDSEATQITWAKENNVSFDADKWQPQICLAQIRKWRPSILYFQDVSFLGKIKLEDFRKELPFIKKIIVHTGFPRDPAVFRGADIILAGVPSIYSVFRKAGFATELFYHYFDTDILAEMPLRPFNDRKYLINFSGSSGYGYGRGHLTRYFILDNLLRNYDATCFLEEPKEYAQTWLAKLMKKEKHPRHKFTPVSLRKKYGATGKVHPPQFGLKYYETLNQSKLGVNIHTDAVRSEVGNMRMFQLAGMGALNITNAGVNLSDLFENEKEVISFENMGNFFEKLDYYLQNPEKAGEISAKGMKKCHEVHSQKNRVSQLLDLIKK